MFHAWLWATQSGASGSNNHLQFMKGAQPLVPPQVHWVRIYILTKSLMTHGQTEVQGVRAEASLEFLYFSRYTLHRRSLALWELNSHTTESHPPPPKLQLGTRTILKQTALMGILGCTQPMGLRLDMLTAWRIQSYGEQVKSKQGMGNLQVMCSAWWPY